MIFPGRFNPTKKSTFKGAARYGPRRWPNNTIPYDISSITCKFHRTITTNYHRHNITLQQHQIKIPFYKLSVHWSMLLVHLFQEVHHVQPVSTFDQEHQAIKIT